jgi:hypothetical protein
MFLGLAVFLILAVLTAVVVLRAVRALFRSGTQARDKKPDKVSERESTRKKTRENDLSEKETLSRKAVLDVSEETRQRFAASLFSGITESFSTGETSFRIDGKALADECVSESALSYLEYNNRELAGRDFYGFNLLVEDDARMVLTYGGSAVASLTLIEREATAVINGETVRGTAPGYRVNTFPPELREGMVVSDLEQMLQAADCIRGLGGNPERVSRAMVGFFTQSENVRRLKASVDRKIQSKESARKDQRRTLSGPRKLTAKPS